MLIDFAAATKARACRLTARPAIKEAGAVARWQRLVCWIATTAAATGALAAEPETIESVEKAASEWVKTRTETVRLESEWASQRGLLESTVKAFQERATTLEEKREQAMAKTADERAELATFNEKKQVAAAELAAVETRLNAIGGDLLRLRPKLPPRLSDALEMSFRSLSGSTLSPGERMQVTMTVLNRCAQFNAAVTCGDEVLVLDGEPAPKSVEAIYWGLSHGYALDRTTNKAWLGSPGPEKWRWEPLPEAGDKIARLIAIYNDKADPELIAVPAHLATNR
jgi:hypothetical protein